METNKYYTPSIEEYHIGFEYQSLTDPRQPEKDIAWSDEELRTEVDMMNVFKYMIQDDFMEHRCKYLDKSDIESFGFKPSIHKGVKCFQMNRFRVNWFDKPYNPQVMGIYAFDDRIDYESQLFRGFVKNKSELSFILKRLGIIK